MLEHSVSTPRTAGAGEIVLDCPDCLDRRLFVRPEDADVAIGDRVCTDCGAAVVLVEPSARPSVARSLRRVA